MGKEPVEKGYVSLVHRTIETQMTAELMEDYAFAAAIARSLKDFFLVYFNTYLGSDRSDGQLLYRAIPVDVPPGIEVAKIKTLPVRLTLFDPSDLEVIMNGTVYLQRHRIIKWAKRRHPDKGHRWIVQRYWHSIDNSNWVFTTFTSTLRLFSDTKIRRHILAQLVRNPFLDADYFSKRKCDTLTRQTTVYSFF